MSIIRCAIIATLAATTLTAPSADARTATRTVKAPRIVTTAAVASLAPALLPNRYVWADNSSMQPVSVIVSIPDQKAYVYRGTVMIAASSVSTGTAEKATPVGTFAILQKKSKHKSNLYDSASMPFMQRLTWDGVALHAGRNPGFPASHGCVRMPSAFAQKLFGVTNVGTLVMVTDTAAADGLTLPNPDDVIPETPAIPDTSAETIAANAGVLAPKK